MPKTGLEPAHLATHAPETCASTNSATWASSALQFLVCSINGAENGTRTRDPNLGKVVLYQLSYFRIFLLSLSLFCKLSRQAFLQMRCKGTTIFRNYKTFRCFFSLKPSFFFLIDLNQPHLQPFSQKECRF